MDDSGRSFELRCSKDGGWIVDGCWVNDGEVTADRAVMEDKLVTDGGRMV